MRVSSGSRRARKLRQGFSCSQPETSKTKSLKINSSGPRWTALHWSGRSLLNFSVGARNAVRLA